MLDKENMKGYAKKLMFEINDEECDILQKEFQVILKQIDLIEKIDGIRDVEPIAFPFITYKSRLRDDEAEESLDIEDVLKNSESSYHNQVKIPKVVE